jgi:NADH dehydrogenase FAD-containing subunit
MVEEDFFDRAKIDIIQGEIMSIDPRNRVINFKNSKETVVFDKMMIAWGATKKNLGKKYSNVFEIEDIYSHAKVHNEI